MSVQITEEFDDRQARFVHYEAADINEQANLLARAHKNIRSFSSDGDIIPRVMYHIDNILMRDMDPLTMADLELTTFIGYEGWTVGSFGRDDTLDKRSTLKVTLPIGTTTTSSTGPAVDLSGFTSTDEFSIAFAAFPSASLDLTQSYVRLSDSAQTVELSLAGVTGTGHVEAKWPLSALGTLTKIVTVEFEFRATAATSVSIAAIRVLSPQWTATKSDINTIFARLEPTVDRVGNIPTAEFPKMWRASDTPGEGDPLPIDTRLGINFFTGAGLHANSVSVFFRARREDYLTQLDLDPADVNNDSVLEVVTQDDLDAFGVQPDYGRAMYNPRPQEDFELDIQNTLDTYTQAYMERLPDLISEAWVEVRLEFGSTNNVYIGTTETTVSGSYSASAALLPNTLYFANIEIINDAVRVRIYPLDAFGRVDTDNIVFDSQEFRGDFIIKRRKGRIGWKIDLEDGDAYVNSMRSRGLVFNEYLSNNLESNTPVVGSRLYVSATPDAITPLATAPLDSFEPVTVEIDTVNSRSSDGSVKVFAPLPLSGIQSQLVPFEDFVNTEISFDLFAPETVLPMQIYLYSERGLFVPLGMPGFTPDTWNHLTVQPLAASQQQTGLYRVIIAPQSENTTFWVDNFTLRQRTVRWSGRATRNDPWGRLRNQWGDFGSLVNSETDGIMFPERGKFCQIRGQALQQEASIDRIYIKPQYAELGRITHGTDAITSIPAPRGKHSVRITSVEPHGSTVAYGSYTWPDATYHAVGDLTFTATVTGATEPIVEYLWDFGDGSEASTTIPAATHTYRNPSMGTIAHCRARDASGHEASASINLMLVP